MTIAEVITEVDELKPNNYENKEKVRWISILEGKIIDEIFKTHLLGEKIEFKGYSEHDMDKTLLVPDTYADVYRYYVSAMIDANNAESIRYASDMALFNAAYSDFSHYYNRTNMPNGNPLRLF